MREYSPADSADYAEECSKLHYFAEKDRLGFVWLLRVIVVLGFVVRLRHLRDQRETLGFLVCRLIEYSHVNILPQIAQITQRGMQQAALFRRERQIGVVNAVLLFWGLSA